MGESNINLPIGKFDISEENVSKNTEKIITQTKITNCHSSHISNYGSGDSNSIIERFS
jgi:hypothetical protein